jgi:putative DNA primase/helicase
MPPITLKHDGPVDLAEGRHRRELNWKNKEWQWSALLNKLSKTHYTAETHAEYMAAKKVRQDEIKDIGGFVGGYLNQGRRKKEAVTHRQLITLDIDLADKDTWENFLLLYSEAACVYSTHKHTAENHRLRIVMPLDRPVAADEYIAIARRIAGDIGIEQFDDSCFRVHQLMYWPSTSKGSEYFFQYQDGPWLSADKVLSSYHDWKDSSEWPVSERYQNVIQQAIKKQGDPLEKPGIVGAWCRNYGIEEVIANELQDVYSPCDVEGRYTYIHGSTAGGLVIYEDKYAYSHHGTDPCSGKLCNAFDLVRLHKYGLKDEDVREGTPGNKLPSFTAMVEFASKDPGVRKLLVSERLEEAHADFSEEWQEGDEPLDDSWQEQLDVDKKGNIQNGIDNIVLLLENDRMLKGCFVFDEFEQRELAYKKLPWRTVEAKDRYVRDADIANLKYFLKERYSITVTTNTIEDALKVVYERNKINSVKDYLKGLKWDGSDRLDTLLINYLGAEDSEYTKAVTRKSLVAAVARVYEPGVKFDNMLTLVGEQGIGKSTIINKLGGKWFSDSFNFHMLQKGKEASEQLQGAWLVEVGELAGLRKADIEAAKSFLSKREDRYRVSYGRRVDFFPRQCVFFGSTNNNTFLRDPSGNRRFWPVKTLISTPLQNVFKDLTKEEVNQVWAEAVTLYKQNEPLFLSAKLQKIAETVQAGYTETDDRVGMVQRYLDTEVPGNWEDMTIYERRAFLANKDGDDDIQPAGTRIRGQVCVAEIWCELLGGTTKDMTSHNTKFIHDIMQHLQGWALTKSTRKFNNYGYQRAYYRVENSEKPTNAKSK